MDRKNLPKAAALLGIVVFLAGISLFIYAGTYSRFWADDYCYSAALKQFGLFRGLIDWYQFSGNRLSTLVVVAFADLFGWSFIRFTTLIVLALYAGAWLFFLNQLRRLLLWAVAWYWLALLALVEVYFATLLAPDRLQTIYWRMGTFHYTLPLALLLINLGLLAFFYRGPGRLAVWGGLLSGLLAFFAAGLSETFAAMQTGALALAITAAFLFLRGARRWRLPHLLAAPLAGSLLMMFLMSQAPANSWRQAVMPPPDNLLLIVPYSLRFAGDFILYTLRGQIVPFIVYIALIGVITLLAVPSDSFRLAPRAGLACAAAALLGMYALIVCSFAPSAFAALSYPAGRALMPGFFALLLGLGTVAFFLGVTARQAFVPAARYGGLTLAAAGLLVILSLYPFRAAGIARADIARLSISAARWDARNAQVRQALGSGGLDVQVRQVDVVQGLEDIGPSPAHWINVCAAGFYGIHTITANP